MRVRSAGWLLTLALAVILTACTSPPSAPPQPMGHTPAVVAAGRLPLAFEPNSGQAPPDVRYVARGLRYRLWLNADEAVFAPPAGDPTDGAALRLRLIGASAPTLAAEDELPGKANYFVGTDPAGWRRNVPTYRRVVYRGIYPGTDLVFHGSQRETEFDFVVAPGADPRAIRFELAGADALALDQGDVVVRTRHGHLRLRKPIVYQETGGTRVPVDGQFALHGRRVAFEVGAYDRARPLVIDPVVTYSTYLGGTGDESGRAIGVDGAGNIYAAIAGMGIVKLSADGSTLLYSTVLGHATMTAIAVDTAGNAYVAGTWPQPRSGFGSEYPVTANALRPSPGQSCFQGSSDGVMAKLSPDGATLLYSSFAGGNCSTFANAIAVDSAGNFYVTGNSSAGGMPTTRPPFGSGASFPGWIQVVAADFSRYVYAAFILAGDGALVEPHAIAVDGTGNAYIAGSRGGGASGDFPTTPGAFQTISDPSSTPWVMKISPDGAQLLYGTYFGNANTRIAALAVDAAGNAYLAGYAAAGLPTASAMQPAPAGGSDAFVAKLNPGGSALIFSTYLGGSADDAATGIGLDGSGNIYVAGGTDSINFPQRNALPPQFGAAGSNFVTVLTPSGSSFVYSTYLADAQTLVNAMTVTPAGTVFLTGETRSTSFPTVRPYQPTFGGGSEFGGDAFITKIAAGSGSCPTGQFLAEYFGNIGLTPPARRTACETAINYNFGAGGPAGLPTDNFSARWTGRFSFAAGTFMFTVRADDGVRVFVDGTLVIDGWRDQPATTYTATRTLTAGEHEVKVEYYERGGDAVIQASWTGGGGAPAPRLTALTPNRATAGGPAFTLTVDGTNFASSAVVVWNGVVRATAPVSSTRLTATIQPSDIATPRAVPVTVRNPDGQVSNALTFTVDTDTSTCPEGQYKAQYFSNIALSGAAARTACETNINYNYAAGGPAGLPVDNFSVRWTGFFQFPGGGVTFTARADDGVRVFLDGVAIIDQWRDQAATTYGVTKTVAAGRHEVRVEYYERGGAAVIQMSWAAGAIPFPTLSALTPANAPAGGPAFTLAADGTNFVNGATLLWNGVARTSTFVSATRVTASIPAGDIAAPGSASVTLRNPNGQTSNARTFTIGPAQGGGTVRVFVTAPTGGATVSGTVWFTVWIENAAAGSKTYTLSVGGSTITSNTTTSNGPVSLAWPTATADNGTRTATVTVRDSAGSTGNASVMLTIKN